MITVLKGTQSKVVALIFLSAGIFILMQVILPIINFQIWALTQKYNQQILISPKENINKQVLGISVQNRDNFPVLTSSLKRISQAAYNKFSLTVPRLKIEKLDVFVDTNDLSQGLAHLPGSALPGEKGNVFISGHSALSQFFDLRSATFSRLSELKKGDPIVVETLGTKFIYEVFDFKIVDPSDLSVVTAPDTLGRYISLMTCVPPGLNFKRLVVLGKMI